MIVVVSSIPGANNWSVKNPDHREVETDQGLDFQFLKEWTSAQPSQWTLFRHLGWVLNFEYLDLWRKGGKLISQN
jgi:hypothetical protein